MMSLRAVHAGQGYQYLLRSVATHDAPPAEGQSLSDYYAVKGTPPGRWIGSGLDGLASEHARAGGVVGEEQMAALYGEGLHPDTDERMARGESLNDCKLGRAFNVYTGGRPVLDAIATAEKAFLRLEGRRPDREERSLIAEQIGRSHYTEATGYTPASGADVIAWVNRQRDQVRQAVAGFDLTFSPVKSVSVLWGLADEQTASRIAALHHEAVADTLAWIENNALYTRIGTNGVEQVRTRGMIASEFTHFDTRTGDPDLHSHVLVSNKVQGPDGKWRSLDSKALHQFATTAAARYNSALQDKLSRTLGVEFEAHHKGPDTMPVFEIAGVDQQLLERFSSRRILARPVYDRLVTDYTTKHGRPPGRRAGYSLWQKAILDTRDAKKPAHSLAEHRQSWREAAVDTIGSENVDGLLDTVWSRPGNEVRFDTETHTAFVAVAAIDAVTGRRSRFRNTHLDTAISAELNHYTFDSDTHRETAHKTALDYAHTRLAVRLSPPEPLALPEVLLRADGAGVDRRANADWYSTKAVLAAEDRVLAAADTPVAVVGNQAVIDHTITAHAEREGWSLNLGQQELAHHLVGAGTLLAAGVGPAGTGKTAAMAVLARAWTGTGAKVIGLAPSAAAARVLAEDLGTPAHTIDSLTHTWLGKHPDKPGRDLAALPIQVGRGDMLLVDEAGMATTRHLAALTEIADTAGAVLRLVGDPAQLDAVDTGGLFRDLARLDDTVHLREVMRMGADHEQAAATLALRNGNPDGLTIYEDRGWLTGGTRSEALTAAVEAFLTDTEQGRRSLVIAGTNADVDNMNDIIRTTRIETGDVDVTREIRVARGDEIGCGDQIIARKNTMLDNPEGRPAGRVINGQLFTVTHIGDDHSVTVRDLDTGQQSWLSAEYVSAHTHLGYATTVHRAQGATVDTTHAVIDGRLDRAGLYVALTRGRKENRVYAVTEHPVDEYAEDAHHHSAGDSHSPTPVDVLRTVVGRDAGQRSARETILDELDHADSDERRRDLYLRGIDIATDTFTAHTLPGFLDTLPRRFAHQIETEAGQYEALTAAWSEAARTGVDPRDHWNKISASLEGARRPGAVIAARLREQLPHRDETPTRPTPPPRIRGDDAELADWLAATGDQLAGDAAGSGEDVELAAARERMVNSVEARRTGEQLADRVQRLESQSTQLSQHKAQLEARMDRGERTGVQGQQVRAEHDRLDSQADAIQRARPLVEQLRDYQQRERHADRQRRRINQELVGLSRVAIRRRRELTQQLETTRAAQEHWQEQARAVRSELSALRASAGSELTWDDTLARAADTRRREQERAHAVTLDRSIYPDAAADMRAFTRDLETARTRHAEATAEIDRRHHLPAAQQTAEHAARHEYQQTQQEAREQRRAAAHHAIADALANGTTGRRIQRDEPRQRPSTTRRPSSRPDLGPEL